MIVCICKGITENQLEKMLDLGQNKKEILKRLKIGQDCGLCVKDAIDMIEENRNGNSKNNPKINSSSVS